MAVAVAVDEVEATVSLDLFKYMKWESNKKERKDIWNKFGKNWQKVTEVWQEFTEFVRKHEKMIENTKEIT